MVLWNLDDLRFVFIFSILYKKVESKKTTWSFFPQCIHLGVPYMYYNCSFTKSFKLTSIYIGVISWTVFLIICSKWSLTILTFLSHQSKFLNLSHPVHLISKVNFLRIWPFIKPLLVQNFIKIGLKLRPLERIQIHKRILIYGRTFIKYNFNRKFAKSFRHVANVSSTLYKKSN